jgi:hypothetical protein
MPKPNSGRPQPDLAKLFNLAAIQAAGNPWHDDATQLVLGFLHAVRDRAGTDAACEAATQLIYAANGILAREAGVGRAHEVLAAAVEALDQLARELPKGDR